MTCVKAKGVFFATPVDNGLISPQDLGVRVGG